MPARGARTRAPSSWPRRPRGRRPSRRPALRRRARADAARHRRLERVLLLRRTRRGAGPSRSGQRLAPEPDPGDVAVARGDAPGGTPPADLARPSPVAGRAASCAASHPKPPLERTRPSATASSGLARGARENRRGGLEDLVRRSRGRGQRSVSTRPVSDRPATTGRPRATASATRDSSPRPGRPSRRAPRRAARAPPLGSLPFATIFASRGS